MTIENVKSAIDKLELINPNEEYAYEKSILHFLTIRKLPVLLYDIPEETPVFRTRTHELNNLFKTISDVSIAPQQLVKNFARCSRPFQPKFYCSEDGPTSYMELVENWVETKKIGDSVFVTFGRWKLKKPMTVILVTSPDKDKRVSEFDRKHGWALDKFLGDCDPGIRDATIMLYRYLFKKFREPAKNDPKTYIITSAYCNLALVHSEGKADGIYYPSVPFEDKGVNFAINSNFVTIDNLDLENVSRNEFKVIPNEDKKLSFKETDLKEATKIDIINDVIYW